MKKRFKIISFSGILILLFSVPMLIPIVTGSKDYNLEQVLSPNPKRRYSPDGEGYIEEIGTNKFLLHLEGTPFKMGYQHGFLCAEAVSYMTSYEFFKQLLLESIGLDYDSSKEFLIEILNDVKKNKIYSGLITDDFEDDVFRIIFDIITYIVLDNVKYVPAEFLKEAEGIASGATDVLGYEVPYINVLLLNMAFDALLSIVYPIVTPLLPFNELLGFHSCNAFIVHGEGTTDGRTIMGRDFMFTEIGFSKYMLLIEQIPDNGNAFVSTSTPGFVGVTAAMNSKGIGIGMDMCPAMDCTPGDYGMGVLFTARKVIQYADELSQAISIIKKSKRGVSWIYALGDGKGDEIGGAAVEVSAHQCRVRRDNYKKPWWMPKIYSQIEKKKDLIVIANHFILTEMNVLALSYGIKDSIWRYKTLTNLILKEYGSIGIDEGLNLIDFLHPPNYQYYGDDTTQPVKAAKSLYDLSNLEVWALFGSYNDEWANHRLDTEPKM